MIVALEAEVLTCSQRVASAAARWSRAQTHTASGKTPLSRTILTNYVRTVEVGGDDERERRVGTRPPVEARCLVDGFSSAEARLARLRYLGGAEPEVSCRAVRPAGNCSPGTFRFLWLPPSGGYVPDYKFALLGSTAPAAAVVGDVVSLGASLSVPGAGRRAPGTTSPTRASVWAKGQRRIQSEANLRANGCLLIGVSYGRVRLRSAGVCPPWLRGVWEGSGPRTQPDAYVRMSKFNHPRPLKLPTVAQTPTLSFIRLCVCVIK